MTNIVGSLTLETPRRRPRSLCFLSGVLQRSLKHATSPACAPTCFTSACPASYATLPAQLPIASLENLPDELLWPPSNPFCHSNSSVFHSQTTWKFSRCSSLLTSPAKFQIHGRLTSLQSSLNSVSTLPPSSVFLQAILEFQFFS